jgi:hypothetical protein
MYEIAILVLAAIFASVIREYYGNKGMFVLPKVTEKGLALGSLSSVFFALFAVLVNSAIIPAELSVQLAISLGIAWGIAAPDIVANVLGRLQNESKKNNQTSS